jgi:hypothetical protein
MTTSVTVKACCDSALLEVLVKVVDAKTGAQQETTLQHGEQQEFYAYEDRVITVREVKKHH